MNPKARPADGRRRGRRLAAARRRGRPGRARPATSGSCSTAAASSGPRRPGVDEVNVVVVVTDTFAGRTRAMDTDGARAPTRRRRRAAGARPRAFRADGHARRGLRLPVRGRGARRPRPVVLAERVAAAGVGRDRPRRHDRRRRPGRRPRPRRAASAPSLATSPPARPLPQHPQHRATPTRSRRRGGRARPRRVARRHRRLPVRPEGHRQHRHRGPRLPPRALGLPAPASTSTRSSPRPTGWASSSADRRPRS